MNLSNKKILLVSPESWDHIHVSKHHYAIHLAKRNNMVYFLNPPGTKYRITSSQYQNLSILDYRGFIPGIRFLPKFIRNNIFRNSIGKLEALCGNNFDILWSFDNSVFFDLDAFPNKFSISHIVDNNMNYEIGNAARSANVCFCTSETIKNKLELYANKIFKINHGVYIPEMNSKKMSLPGDNKLKATYIGNLAMRYIDWEIILKAVEKFPTIDFVFIGPNKFELGLEINPHHKYKERVLNKENTYFINSIPSSEILNHLISSDILLIAYREEHHADQSNPHKVLEYLLSGKPVMATFTDEYENIEPSIIAMVKQNYQWLDAFANIVNNIDYFQSDVLSEKRKQIAHRNTYDKQLNKIEGILCNEDSIR